MNYIISILKEPAMELDIANLIEFVVCPQWAAPSCMIGLKQKVVVGSGLSKHVFVSLLRTLNELRHGNF